MTSSPKYSCWSMAMVSRNDTNWHLGILRQSKALTFLLGNLMNHWISAIRRILVWSLVYSGLSLIGMIETRICWAANKTKRQLILLESGQARLSKDSHLMIAPYNRWRKTKSSAQTVLWFWQRRVVTQTFFPLIKAHSKNKYLNRKTVSHLCARVCRSTVYLWLTTRSCSRLLNLITMIDQVIN